MTLRNSWPVTGAYSGEEISVTFTAMMERDWIGHPDVPNGTQDVYDIDPASIEVESVEILAVTVDYKTLPDVVQDLIFDLNTEVEWEPAE